MIRVLTQKEAGGPDTNAYLISAFADTKTEVTSEAEFVGLPENAKIEMSSTVITASGELAFMTSNGMWNWI